MSQKPKSPAPEVAIHPSAKLLKPFYWTAAAMAGFILFYSNNTGTNLDWLLIVPAALTIWTLTRHLRLRYTKLSVTSGKLRYETGMFSRSVRTMEIGKVQDVVVKQTLLERMLSLGTISIETAGETSRLTMSGIEQPQEVADYILEAVRR